PTVEALHRKALFQKARASCGTPQRRHTVSHSKETEMKHTATVLLAVMFCSPTLFRNASGMGQPETLAIASVVAADEARLARLESLLEGLRQELKIPALSAAVVKDQKVLWARGFGYADLENKVPATEHTPYHLASLTKTYASTILMQLVQEGKIKLDDPVSRYGINLESNGVIRVRHLLSHTSEGNPGEQYRYNGNRFAELDKVIQKATGKSFTELLIANILDPLGMDETAPNVVPVADTKSPIGTDRAAEDEVRQAVMNLTNGFKSGDLDQVHKYVASEESTFRSDGGLLSSFVDWEGLRDALKGGLRIELLVQDLEVAVYGNSAVATCLITNVVTPPGGNPET